jgi:hypothetical protein
MTAHARDPLLPPKSVLEKLGVKLGLKVAVLGGFDEAFRRDVTGTLGVKPLARAARGCDLVFVRLERPGDEARLARLIAAIEPDGALWAVYAKGRRELSENTVRAAALGMGLVDIKVVAFSEALSALKLVIPRALRSTRR